jgi:hypothetical protein
MTWVLWYGNVKCTFVFGLLVWHQSSMYYNPLHLIFQNTQRHQNVQHFPYSDNMFCCKSCPITGRDGGNFLCVWCSSSERLSVKTNTTLWNAEPELWCHVFHVNVQPLRSNLGTYSISAQICHFQPIYTGTSVNGYIIIQTSYRCVVWCHNPRGTGLIYKLVRLCLAHL